MSRDIPIIDDPLDWQARVDASYAPINTYSASRFWKTVNARGLRVVYRNGIPDFNLIDIDLGDGIGLRLSTTSESAFIKYRFIELEETEEDTQMSNTQHLEEQLSAPGKILLAIMRDTMRQGIPLMKETGEIIAKHLGVTEQDWKIIGDCLEADVAEMLTTWKPRF